jgi:hypothetical protein
MNIREEFISKIKEMDIDEDIKATIEKEAAKMDLTLVRQFLGRIAEMELQRTSFLLDLGTIHTAASER